MCACVFCLSWGQFWESNKCPIFKMSILFVLFFCVLDSPATKHQIARAFLCQTIYPFRWIWIWRTKSCAVKKQFVLQKLSCSSKRQTQNFKFHQKELNCRTIKRLNGGKMPIRSVFIVVVASSLNLNCNFDAKEFPFGQTFSLKLFESILSSSNSTRIRTTIENVWM